MYKFVRAPREGGMVCTIAPVDDLSIIKHVHCALLKTQIWRDSLAVIPPDSSQVDQVFLLEEDV